MAIRPLEVGRVHNPADLRGGVAEVAGAIFDFAAGVAHQPEEDALVAALPGGVSARGQSGLPLGGFVNYRPPERL